MVGDATSRYVHANPSLCEDYDNGTEKILDITECPKALEVVFTITFATGLIMVRIVELEFLLLYSVKTLGKTVITKYWRENFNKFVPRSARYVNRVVLLHKNVDFSAKQ